jgi:3-oxoadipate enol-lactonase
MNWIDVNGVAIRYRLEGEGPTIVLVHEMGGTLESWDRVAPHLARSRRVLRFDCRGAGLSEKITGEVELADFAADLLALLDALGIDEPVTLAGCAVGAGIVIRFALDYPERAASLILLNPAIDTTPDSGGRLVERSQVMAREGMRSIEAGSLDTGYPEFLRARDPEHYRSFRARWLANDPRSLGAMFRMLARTNLFPELSAIRIPVLALAGRHDPLRPPAYVRSVVAPMARHEFAEIDAAHHVPDQAPEIVREAIAAFLDRVHPAPARRSA